MCTSLKKSALLRRFDPRQCLSAKQRKTHVTYIPIRQRQAHFRNVEAAIECAWHRNRPPVATSAQDGPAARQVGGRRSKLGSDGKAYSRRMCLVPSVRRRTRCCHMVVSGRRHPLVFRRIWSRLIHDRLGLCCHCTPAVAVDVMSADDDESCPTFRTQATRQKCLNFTSTLSPASAPVDQIKFLR